MVKALIGWAVVAVVAALAAVTFVHRHEILATLNRPAADMTIGDVLLLTAFAVAFLRKN